jgi:hypothetical protein
MASMVATGDAVPMRMSMDAVEIRALELKRAGDPRPMGLLRLAALTEFILGDQQTARPQVEAVIVTDLTTQLGLTKHPGELSGYGPISPETARELTKDATLRRLITDPLTGIMIDLGQTRYQPSKMLRRIVDAKHRTCRFPGCSRRAIKCDCDHKKTWISGGRTMTTNLHPLCRMHHNLKTDKLWHVEINDDGSETWTSPLGYVYVKPASAYPLEFFDPPGDEDAEVDPYLVQQTDPDPPSIDDPLLEPPPITDEEYAAFTDALEARCYAHANENYDAWWNLGLVS